MEITVLEWLRSLNGYGMSDVALQTIAIDRGSSVPSNDSYSDLTQKDKELMQADLIYTAILNNPSSTASVSRSHSGFQESRGSQTDLYQGKKLDWAMRVYERYGDERYDQTLTKSKLIVINPFKNDY